MDIDKTFQKFKREQWDSFSDVDRKKYIALSHEANKKVLELMHKGKGISLIVKVDDSALGDILLGWVLISGNVELLDSKEVKV